MDITWRHPDSWRKRGIKHRRSSSLQPASPAPARESCSQTGHPNNWNALKIPLTSRRCGAGLRSPSRLLGSCGAAPSPSSAGRRCGNWAHRRRGSTGSSLTCQVLPANNAGTQSSFAAPARKLNSRKLGLADFVSGIVFEGSPDPGGGLHDTEVGLLSTIAACVEQGFRPSFGPLRSVRGTDRCWNHLPPAIAILRLDRLYLPDRH